MTPKSSDIRVVRLVCTFHLDHKSKPWFLVHADGTHVQPVTYYRTREEAEAHRQTLMNGGKK